MFRHLTQHLDPFVGFIVLVFSFGLGLSSKSGFSGFAYGLIGLFMGSAMLLLAAVHAHLIFCVWPRQEEERS